MEYKLLFRYIGDRLHDRTTYVVALIVGTLINVYGHLLVPWIRTSENAFILFEAEFSKRPILTLISMFIAFAFPFCVGIYSAVSARYKNRRIESIADFPERKPDPVFRANQNGQLLELGSTTKTFFEKYDIVSADQFLGADIWSKIKSGNAQTEGIRFHFKAEGAEYLVAHTMTKNDNINIYLTRMPGS